MRQKRAKAYRKLMNLYSISFGFRQPYQVLIDSEICKIAIQSNIELVKQIGTVLQGTVKPMITQCCIHELYLQGPSVQPAVDLAKTFERRKCNHKTAIPGDDCLTSVVGETNKHRYVLATQSQDLRTNLRTIPAVPIIHINRSVMVLEPVSDVTLKAKEDADEKALQPSQSELATLPRSYVELPQRKKKGPKGPNPLSVKKKKKIADTPTTKKRASEHINTGMKRKHEAGDSDQDNASIHQVDEDTKDGHKRKRRRKRNEVEAG